VGAASVAARPEPTRDAVLAAYRSAVGALPALPAAPAVVPVPPPRAAAATTVSVLARSTARPAPSPATYTPFGISTLSRVQTEDQPAPVEQRAEGGDAKTPDLDLITDHVLERLRHELRDGRERLGFLLDDNR
jgi:hypothetical protein